MASSDVPLFNGLATWACSIGVGCFQGHQEKSLPSQFLIACVTILSFAFVVVQPWQAHNCRNHALQLPAFQITMKNNGLYRTIVAHVVYCCKVLSKLIIALSYDVPRNRIASVSARRASLRWRRALRASARRNQWSGSFGRRRMASSEACSASS